MAQAKKLPEKAHSGYQVEQGRELPFMLLCANQKEIGLQWELVLNVLDQIRLLPVNRNDTNTF